MDDDVQMTKLRLVILTIEVWCVRLCNIQWSNPSPFYCSPQFDGRIYETWKYRSSGLWLVQLNNGRWGCLGRWWWFAYKCHHAFVYLISQNADMNQETTVHVDAFLFDQEDIDRLCDEGKLSRNYCCSCGSHSTAPLSKLCNCSHPTNAE